jgi:hypothetical protein
MTELRATLDFVANRGVPGGKGNNGSVRRRAVPENATHVVCRWCGQDKPVAEMAHSRAVDGTRRPSRTCRACRKARELETKAGRLTRTSQDSVDQAPDHRPAVRVRAQLQRDREAGLPWRTRHFVAVVRASCADDLDGREWKMVLESQIPAWRRGYTRKGPTILTLSPSLFDDPEFIEQSDPVRAVA